MGIEPLGDPPAFWAVSRGTPGGVALFPLDVSGTVAFDDAPYLVASNDTHYATGQSFEAVGDRDGDGIHEVAVASSDGVPNTGQVYVLAPQLDPVLEESPEIWRGTVEGGETGWRMDGQHDLDGDGAPDLAVGTPGFDTWRGMLDVVPYLGLGDRLLQDHAFAHIEGEAAYILSGLPRSRDRVSRQDLGGRFRLRTRRRSWPRGIPGRRSVGGPEAPGDLRGQ